MQQPIIILGAGHAAYSLAREIRRHDSEKPLVLITSDSGDSYYKPNLSKALASQKTPDQLVLKTREQQEEALNIQVMAEQTVSAIDAANKTVHVADGKPLSYQQLVLAYGAESRRFTLEGNANSAVLHVNDLDEYRVFVDRIQQAQHILIMGAGLVGCEFANDLHSQGISSTLVDPAAYPLAALLPEALGQALQQGLNDIGVQQHYATSVKTLNGTNGNLKALLKNEKTVAADVVLSAAGLVVDTALADHAGIESDRGIVVNSHLQTNLADIYALGDCAQIEGRLRPYIAPILPSVKALAQTLLGNPTPLLLKPMPVTVKTPCCPVVACPPEINDGKWQISGQGQDLLAKHINQQGQLTGYACTGEKTAEARALMAEINNSNPN